MCARAAILLALCSAPLLADSLQLVSAGVRQIEDGPSVGPGVQFIPGETVYFSFQAAGYATTTGDPLARKVKLSYLIDVFDPKGVKVVEPVESVLDTTLTEQDKDWKPKIRSDFLIPPFAPPGKYRISFSLKDDIARKDASAEVFFEVAGHEVAPSADLAVRNFGFYRSPEESKPLSIAAYRAGDTLFARFDITGFRHGERNSIDVAYDVAVQNPDGKVIYTQLKAAGEKSDSFYPKPFVPGAMNLSLQSNMRKGEYAVILTAHDAIGHQNVELRVAFQVE